MTQPVPHIASERDQERPLALSRGRLVTILSDTLRDLDSLTLPMPLEDAAAQRQCRERVMARLRDQLLPRLAQADTPAIVVVGGSTGAGKSTLVNSVLGVEVSAAGVLRPTTRTPVLVMNPEDGEAIAEHPLSEICEVIAHETVPAGLALVDASDLDSVQESNRALAGRLLESADLWLFITTPARYGDLTPWATLEEAARRKVPVAVVLNRASRAVLTEVRRDLVSRLGDLGLAEAPFFVVADAGAHEGLLPADSVAELRTWLELLAGRHRAAGLLRRTEASVWTALHDDLLALAEAADAHNEAAAVLDDRTDACAQDASTAIDAALSAGVASQGAPATRWVTLAASGAPLASLAHGETLRRGWRGRKTQARSEALSQLAHDSCAVVELAVDSARASLATALTDLWEQAGMGEQARELLAAAPTTGQVLTTWRGRPWGGPTQASHGLGEHSDQEAPASAIPTEESTHQGENNAKTRPLVMPARTPAALADGATLPTVTGLEAAALADLITAAAAGLDGATTAATRLGLEAEVTASRSRLIACAQSMLMRMIPSASATASAPTQTLAAALRVRAAELSPLLPVGGTR